jgi:hypothetical protein
MSQHSQHSVLSQNSVHSQLGVNSISDINCISDINSISDIENQITTQTENQINRSLTNSTNTSNPNITADEWTSEIEELVVRWKDQIEKLSYVHQESGYISKVRYYRLAIPSIIIPFIMTLVSQNLYTDNQNPGHIVDGVAFMATSILSALSVFFGYSQAYEQHFQFSARYTDISNRIDSELARRRKFRTPSDVFITELKCKIESLNDSSPNLPGNWC